MRKTSALRDLVRETDLSAGHLVYPLFVTHGSDRREPIEAMPGIERLTISHLEDEAGEIAALGIPAVLLFGIPAHKDEAASGAYDPEGIVQLAVRALKQAQPELTVITDVCLCEYMSHGHCGVIRDDGYVDNDVTLELLAKTAISHAESGADAVAPSDMMDGRVGRSGHSSTPRATPTCRSSPTAPSSRLRSTGRSGKPPTRRRPSVTAGGIRWTRPTRERRCARRRSTSTKAPTS
jgi:delta-aminolevulinic acid dehydratase/porphobilinogen synthase